MWTLEALRERFGRGLQLRPDLVLEWGEDSLALHGEKKWEIPHLSASDRHFLRVLRQGILLEDSLAPFVITPRIQKFLTLFLEKDLLKALAPLSSDPSRFERQVEWLSYFSPRAGEIQDALEQKRVALVGCGGTGSLIAIHLARSGIRHFLLIDGAVVDTPDLNRQLAFYPKDVGKEKTIALGDHLRDLDPSIECVTHNQFIEGAGSLEHLLRSHPCDLVINCADKPMGLIHAWVVSAALVTETPVLFGGVGLESASVGPLLIGADSKRSYQEDLERAASRITLEEQPLKASLCYTNTIAATWLAFEAFRFLTGVGECATLHRALRINFVCGTFEEEKNWAVDKKGRVPCAQ